MNRKTVIAYIGYLVFCILAFSLGRLSVSNKASMGAREDTVKTYSVDGIATSFNLAWPTYGLPLAEYTHFLQGLRADRAEEVIPKLETALDLAVYDAKYRYPLLTGQDLRGLTKNLSAVASYRERFPRPLDTRAAESWQEKQKAIDSFLVRFGPGSTNGIGKQ